jgi:hypothetical protein
MELTFQCYLGIVISDVNALHLRISGVILPRTIPYCTVAVRHCYQPAGASQERQGDLRWQDEAACTPTRRPCAVVSARWRDGYASTNGRLFVAGTRLGWLLAALWPLCARARAHVPNRGDWRSPVCWRHDFRAPPGRGDLPLIWRLLSRYSHRAGSDPESDPAWIAHAWFPVVGWPRRPVRECCQQAGAGGLWRVAGRPLDDQPVRVEPHLMAG